ncbi:MAG: hypothetical protein K2X48_19535 [Chitinophagaceae bacterium]|nr:hypothetical protein [Chitinophagaceae bacterium]
MSVIKQFKIPLLLFLAGMLLNIFGAWAKIIHLSFADLALTAGMLVQGAGVAAAIYLLVKDKR